MASRPDLAELLRWYVDAGADEAIGEAPRDRYTEARTPDRPAGEAERTVPPPPEPTPPAEAAPPLPEPSTPPPGVAESPRAAAASGDFFVLASPEGAARSAAELAAACSSLDELAETVRGFEGCALRETATNLVFGDGNPHGEVMFIGEAPGADEDRQGLPFVGVSGQLLDRMLATIGLDRGRVYITNMIHWRPPGNRKPTTAEITSFQPFIERQIELVAPRILVLVGGTAASALLGRREGITKLRGRWLSYARPGLEIPCMATYHPAFLLRQPGLKRDSWRDLLEIRAKLDSLA